jgi:rod shape-determining protein MreC
VARVVGVEKNSADAFARITCVPIGGTDRNRHVLVLLVDKPMPPAPPPEAVYEQHRNRKLAP